MFTIYDILKNSIDKYFADIDHQTVFDQHRNVVNAIKSGDSDMARQRILEHLDYVESRLKDIVGSKAANPGI